MFDKIWKCLLLLVLAAAVFVGMVHGRYTLVPVGQMIVVEHDRITGHTRVGEIESGTAGVGSARREYGYVMWLEPPAQ